MALLGGAGGGGCCGGPLHAGGLLTYYLLTYLLTYLLLTYLLAEAGLLTQAGFFRPFGTTDTVSVDAGSRTTSERDPPHPGVDVLNL